MDLNWFMKIAEGVNWSFVLFLWIGLLVSGQIRYGFVAGVIHYICTIKKRESWLRYRVQLPFVKKERILTEIKWSFLTGLVFSTIEFSVIIGNSFGLTKLYPEISDHGILYFITSIVLMIVIHDAYFYWSHRLLHWKPLYKNIHRIHHESVSTTAFTSFTFHPVEAVIQLSILPLVMVIMPVHWLSLTIFLSYMTLFNILWHNSYEFWPRGVVKNKIFGIFSTPTHHNIHHKRVNYNYGLYLTYWDRLMGTMHPDYEKIFDQIKGRTEESLKTYNKGNL